MSNGAPYNNRISLHATMEAAWAAMMDIVTKWGQAQGAVSPGAKVSIVDTRDGGILFSAEYLGFEPNLLSEGQQ
jgi:hypothetical protein